MLNVLAAHSLVDLLDRDVARVPAAIAVRDRTDAGMIEWPYREYAAQVYRLARLLKERGVTSGQTVGILLPNCRWWGVAFLAVQALDAVAVPIDIRLGVDETAAIVKAAGITVLVAAAHFKEKTGALVPAGVRLAQLVELDTHAAQGALGGEPTPLPRLGMRCNPAVIIYTSGTTGTPKGVVLTNANLLTNVADLLDLLEISAQEHFVSVLPLNHVYEITGGFLAPLALGASVTYASSLRPDIIFKTIRDAEMTVMMVVPAFLRLFMERIKVEAAKQAGARFTMALRLSKALLRCGIPAGRILFRQLRAHVSPRFKCFISGGAPVDPELVFEYAALGLTVLQGYGLTETSPVIAVNTLRHNRLGSVGRPVASAELRIEPVEGRAQGEGELWVRGALVFKDYFRAPELTAAAFHMDWFRTGDLVRMDRAGYLHICGRIKNLIVTEGGKKVVPEDIEHVLLHCPFVLDACVLGMPGKEQGEEPVAVIVPAREKAAALCGTDHAAQDALVRRELQAALAGIADYKRPRRFVFLDELPRTATLKVKRHELRRMLE